MQAVPLAIGVYFCPVSPGRNLLELWRSSTVSLGISSMVDEKEPIPTGYAIPLTPQAYQTSGGTRYVLYQRSAY